MFCPHCGNQVKDGAKFCAHCGSSIEARDTQAKTSASIDSSASSIASKASAISQGTNKSACPPVVQQPKDKTQSKTGLIIGCVIGVLALIAAIVVAVFMIFGNQSEGDKYYDKNQMVEMGSAVSTGITNTDNESLNVGNTAASNTNENAASVPSSGQALESADHILPDVATRNYSETELEALTDEELYYARNEIFARHGRGFKNQDLIDYFSSKTWYSEQYSPSDFDAMPSPLNEYEKANSDLIREIESDRNSPYLN